MKGCIVVVSGDDESCSTALIRFGSVCVAGYRVAGCAIYGQGCQVTWKTWKTWKNLENGKNEKLDLEKP